MKSGAACGRSSSSIDPSRGFYWQSPLARAGPGLKRRFGSLPYGVSPRAPRTAKNVYRAARLDLHDVGNLEPVPRGRVIAAGCRLIPEVDGRVVRLDVDLVGRYRGHVQLRDRAARRVMPAVPPRREDQPVI